jgi:hypothetical protein
VIHLFFDPGTSSAVRYAMATELEKFRDYQFFYQTLSCLMMGNFPDPLALIRALKSFANPESVPILMQHYPQASWDERLEIIETLGGLDSIESLEFLSKVYNELQEYPELSKVQQNQMQERLAMALARRMMV